MDAQSIKGMGIKELLMDFVPKTAKEMIATRGPQEELAGTEMSILVEVSGTKYNYVVKDGTDFQAGEGDLANPMISISLSEEDMNQMIAQDNMDMLLGSQEDLTRSKFDALSNTKGTLVNELTNDDQSVSSITIVFNGADAPRTVMKMKTSDARALAKKEANPVNLFMAGQVKIEGDMAFAMALQPILG